VSDEKKKGPVTQDVFDRVVKRVDKYIDKNSVNPAVAERFQADRDASYWEGDDLVLCTTSGLVVARIKHGAFVTFVLGLKDE